MKRKVFELEARDVYEDGTVECPSVQEYITRLESKGLFGKDKNSVGACWLRKLQMEYENV